ncbi:MAG: hypothetical protein LBN74_09520 [Prevotella sp.]|jgi:hypothetical protein|nr:hypothetical protein [Prevotella sp.]
MAVTTINGEVSDIRTLTGDFKIKNNSLSFHKRTMSVGTIVSTEAGAFSATFRGDSMDAVLEGNTVKGTLKLEKQPPYEFVAKPVEYKVCSSCDGKGFKDNILDLCSSCLGLGVETSDVLMKNL